MNEIDNGGSAFPESCNGSIIPGMVLLDYFAAQALAGLALEYCCSPTTGARLSYELADAMIAQRKKAHE